MHVRAAYHDRGNPSASLSCAYWRNGFFLERNAPGSDEYRSFYTLASELV